MKVSQRICRYLPENGKWDSGHRPSSGRGSSAQDVRREPDFGLSVPLEKRIPTIAVERLEAFLASLTEDDRATEVGWARIQAVPINLAWEAGRTRRFDSLLARSRKQESYGRVLQATGGRDVS